MFYFSKGGIWNLIDRLSQFKQLLFKSNSLIHPLQYLPLFWCPVLIRLEAGGTSVCCCEDLAGGGGALMGRHAGEIW